MKLDLFQRRSPWSSCARVFAQIAASALIFSALAFPADEAKTRIKTIRETAKQGSSAIPQIAPYISDPDAGVRLEAVKAIVSLDTVNSLDPLVKALNDNGGEVQFRATEGLVNFYLPGYVQTGMTAPLKKMTSAMKSRFTDTNDQVIDAYVKVRPDIIVALGKVARGGASMDSRAGACRALGILRGREALPDLIAAIQSSDTDVNYEALIALQKIKDESAAPAIVFRLRDPSEKVQLAAIETTGLLKNRAALNQLRDAMDRSKSQKVKRAALTAIAIMPEESIRGVLIYRLQDKDDGLRAAAAEGLGRLRNPSDLAALKNSYDQEKSVPVRMAAAMGLVYNGQREMTDFAPLRYLVNQLNSAAYRGVAIGYLKELVRDPAVREATYVVIQENPPKDEKLGICDVYGASGDRDSVPQLETLSKDPNPEVAKEALRAIQNIGARTTK